MALVKTVTATSPTSEQHYLPPRLKAGETIQPYSQLVTINAAGAVVLADADDATLRPAVGVITQYAEDGDYVDIIDVGWLEYDDWSWTPGEYLYLGTTAGAFTAGRPGGGEAQCQIVGVSVSATRVRLKIEYGYA